MGDNRLVQPNRDCEEDAEALFAELEAEIENADKSATREHGLDTFKREMERVKDMKENGHGQYTEIMDEREVIQVTAKEPRCIVHFYHPHFRRCEIMDKHMAKLAPKYFSTRFIRVFVENIPWLVEKLSIKVLPCVICFVDGVTRDRIVGFEALGNRDDFETVTLETRFLMNGSIEKSSDPLTSLMDTAIVTSAVKSSRQDEDVDEVFDLDE